MLKIKAIILFHKKLAVPSLAFSLLIGLYSIFMNDQVNIAAFGMPYLLLPSLMQYFIYEIKNKDEYFFYHNIGLSKIYLWVSTLIISLLGAIFISIITWIVYKLTVL